VGLGGPKIFFPMIRLLSLLVPILLARYLDKRALFLAELPRAIVQLAVDCKAPSALRLCSTFSVIFSAFRDLGTIALARSAQQVL